MPHYVPILFANTPLGVSNIEWDKTERNTEINKTHTPNIILRKNNYYSIFYHKGHLVLKSATLKKKK